MDKKSLYRTTKIALGIVFLMLGITIFTICVSIPLQHETKVIHTESFSVKSGSPVTVIVNNTEINNVNTVNYYNGTLTIERSWNTGENMIMFVGGLILAGVSTICIVRAW